MMKRLVILSAACGVGKSTLVTYLEEHHLLDGYVCIDSDGVGINWWNYAGTDHEHMYCQDCLDEAIRQSGDRHLFFATCMNPCDFAERIILPSQVTDVAYIGMICSDEAMTLRLRARPPERMCSHQPFIDAQIDYNRWFLANTDKFQLFLDNTAEQIEETAQRIAFFVNFLK